MPLQSCETCKREEVEGSPLENLEDIIVSGNSIRFANTKEGEFVCRPGRSLGS